MTVHGLPEGEISKDQRIINEISESGEPVFILRGKDFFTLQTIQHYAQLVENFGPNNFEFTEQIYAKINEIRDWQSTHMGKVRYPD